MGLNPCIFNEDPGFKASVDTYTADHGFYNWLNLNMESAPRRYNRKMPTIKCFHVMQSLKTYSDKQILLTFHEVDQLTETEANVLKNSIPCVTTKDSQSLFASHGISTELVPLGFDSNNFARTNKTYFGDGRITFNIAGKFEKRKHHEKTIQAWIKKFGNDKRYSLQCSLFNPFISEEDSKKNFIRTIGGKNVFNVSFLPWMQKNSIYNDYLNSADIIIGMSGAEGWGLPEFQSVAMGKHAVILNSSGYKEWANSKNATIVNPCGKIEIYDGLFFRKGAPFNQGSIYDFNESEFISACEAAIAKVEQNKVNEEGLKLQDQFKYSTTANKLLSLL